jgi:hypothetical protein
MTRKTFRFLSTAAALAAVSVGPLVAVAQAGEERR